MFICGAPLLCTATLSTFVSGLGRFTSVQLLRTVRLGNISWVDFRLRVSPAEFRTAKSPRGERSFGNRLKMKLLQGNFEDYDWFKCIHDHFKGYYWLR